MDYQWSRKRQREVGDDGQPYAARPPPQQTSFQTAGFDESFSQFTTQGHNPEVPLGSSYSQPEQSYAQDWNQTQDTRDSEQQLEASAARPDTLVCYGMVPGFRGTYMRLSDEPPSQSADPMNFRVTIESSHQFVTSGHVYGRGKFASDYVDVVQALLDEQNLQVQAICRLEDAQSDKLAKKSRAGLISIPCAISIIIYGPESLIRDVGDFFQEIEMYLQDPKDCDLNTRYCNPHRLSSLSVDGCPMTFDLDQPSMDADPTLFQRLSGESDMLDIFEAHQKQALTFLARREEGWDFSPQSADFWDLRQTSQDTFFLNNVSEKVHTDEPLEFRGGIIADPMGLGKTLTMIALVAAGKPYASQPSLIVVPPPLLDTWEEQLEQHVRPGGLKWRRHYGKDRLSEADGVSDYDIILSTYHTASADWAGGLKEGTSMLFNTQWQRIILDEAHVVRNIQAQMSKAVCALNASARWAVTGTPIQNKIGDLAALLKFIKAHPYNEVRQFDADIGSMWKSGYIEEAVSRLRKLSAGLILRRPKTVIELPRRTDLKFPVVFSGRERDLYEKLKHQTIAKMEELFHDGGAASNSYISVMQRINALRMICDLGMYYDARHDLMAAEEAHHALEDWPAVAQQTFNFHRDVVAVSCSMCDAPCDTATAPILPIGGVESPNQAYFAKCRSYVCGDCAQRRVRRHQPVVCGHTPGHSIAPVSTSWVSLEETNIPTVCGMFDPAASFRLSSKVTALVSQIQHLPTDVKSVVFSSWRMTLDLVEIGLKQAGVSYLRFDGKVRQQDRQTIIDRFRKDPTIQVFLLTISCGAVGLTLTEASRAYLVEPHWNPTIEEQALARVYRLGQEKEVTTVRFYVKDTFEERVLDLQRSKRKLEEVLLDPKKGTDHKDELDCLEDLRRLI
ncbi:SNF2 family N-terminal domain-containing protein [Echria macrotheca]|uniref:SNF2 family N-terminal domain-containing protein n=1 Tax=Echria macrotheca TaxID=438768 RepID=A0AAJ0B2F5_9PEZI|nr:SNF2 family N-terminal domain-containing protein [Echria macrotheca]